MPRTLKRKPIDMNALLNRAEELGKEAVDLLCHEYGCGAAQAECAIYRMALPFLHAFQPSKLPEAIEHFTSQESENERTEHQNQLAAKYG